MSGQRRPHEPGGRTERREKDDGLQDETERAIRQKFFLRSMPAYRLAT
jgi:hypothetical protein